MGALPSEKKSPSLSTKLRTLAIDHQLQLQIPNLSLTPPLQDGETDSTATVCKTPTAKEHRIPDIMTCPPAPRKRKYTLPVFANGNASKRCRIVKRYYFSSPEVEAALGFPRLTSKIGWTSGQFRLKDGRF